MDDDTTLFIPVILGTTRTGGRSARVARFVLGGLQARPGVRTELVDLGALALPVMLRRLSDEEAPAPGLDVLAATVARSDAIAIVAPEYKNGYPGSLKNALDYLNAGAFRRRPIAIATVSSGGFGGINCLAQLRLVCLAMGGVPIPASLPVSRVDDALDEEGKPLDPRLAEKLGPFLDEFLWYAEGLAPRRRRGETSIG